MSKLLQNLFQYTVSSSNVSIGPLDELVTDGIDVESVWEQVQSRNRPFKRYVNKTISKLNSSALNAIASSQTRSIPTIDNDEEQSASDDSGGDVEGAMPEEEEDAMEQWLDDVEDTEQKKSASKSKKVIDGGDADADNGSIDEQVS